MKVELCHALEDAASLFSMGLGVREGDEEVIHVDDEPSFSDHVSEGVICESLKRGGGVVETKEHNHWFKESLVCDEGGLPLMAIFDMNVVVPPTNIKLGEVASILQLVHEVRDEGKRVDIIGGMFVEVTVVLAGAEFTVFLLNKEEEGCLKRVGRADLPSS